MGKPFWLNQFWLKLMFVQSRRLPRLILCNMGAACQACDEERVVFDEEVEITAYRDRAPPSTITKPGHKKVFTEALEEKIEVPTSVYSLPSVSGTWGSVSVPQAPMMAAASHGMPIYAPGHQVSAYRMAPPGATGVFSPP